MEYKIPSHEIDAIAFYNLKEQDAINIANKTNHPIDLIKQILRYNIVPIKHLAFLLNTSVSTISRAMGRQNRRRNKIIVHIKNTYPWDIGKELEGPQFIIVDYECIAYIKKHLKID